MKGSTNYVIVEVEEEKETKMSETLTGPDGNPIPLYNYTSKEVQDTNQYNKIYGTVVAVPQALRNLPPLYAVHEGTPKPVKSCGFDELKQREKAATKYSPLNAEKVKAISKHYSLANGKTEYIYDKEIRVQKGDRVYFHYLSIADDHWMGPEHPKCYKVPYTGLHCAVRDGELIMINFTKLVEPYYDEKYQEIDVGEFTVRAKQNSFGLVTSVKDDPEYLKGWCEGKKIIFKPDSECARVIEGKSYYVMKEWDIVAYFDPLIPIDPFVSIIPEIQESEKSIRLLKPKFTNIGTIDSPGEYEGERVYYNPKGEENIYLKEYNRMIVHKEDVMAIIE